MDRFGLFSAKEMKPIIATEEIDSVGRSETIKHTVTPTVEILASNVVADEKPKHGGLRLGEMERDVLLYDSRGGYLSIANNCKCRNSQIKKKQAGIDIETDTVAQAMTHPYLREVLTTKGFDDSNIQKIYDHFFCQINRHRTDIGFQYVSKNSNRGIYSGSIEDDLKYHLNDLVRYQPIQLRIELINQTMSDYQRCNKMD